MAVEVKVNVDTNRASAQWNQFANQIKSGAGQLGGQLQGLLGGPAIAGGILGGLVYGAKEALQAFNEADKVARQFAVTLKNIGDTSTETAKAYADAADQISKVTATDDEEITQLMGKIIMLTRTSGEHVVALTQSILDMSTAVGMSSEGITRLVARSAESGKNLLRRYNVDVQLTTDKIENMRRITEALGKQFGGAAAAQAATLEGRIKSLTITFENFKETIGELLNVWATPLLEIIGKGFTALVYTISVAFQSLFRQIAIQAQQALPWVTLFVALIKKLGGPDLTGMLKTVADGITYVLDKTKDAPKTFDEFLAGLGGGIERANIPTKLGAVTTAVGNLEYKLKEMKALGLGFISPEQEATFNRWLETAQRVQAFMAQSPNTRLLLMLDNIKTYIQNIQPELVKTTEMFHGMTAAMEADLEDMKQKAEVIANALAQSIVSGFQSAFTATTNAAKAFFKTMLNVIISGVEALLAAALAASFAKAILSFGWTLVGDIAMYSAGIAALEGVKALIARFHEGGTVPKDGTFVNAPPNQEFPILVRGGETIRTEEQERALQTSNSSMVFNFNGDGWNEESVVKAISKMLKKTGLSNVDDLVVGNRGRLSIA